jgi:hypothetical protein
VNCPLCNGPTEEHEAYRDRACPRCGLAAPTDVLERIAKLRELDADAEIRALTDTELAHALGASCDVGKGRLCSLIHHASRRLEALEAEVARLKRPAHVLADATRVWRLNCECACSACRILNNILTNQEGGRDG